MILVLTEIGRHAVLDTASARQGRRAENQNRCPTTSGFGRPPGIGLLDNGAIWPRCPFQLCKNAFWLHSNVDFKIMLWTTILISGYRQTDDQKCLFCVARSIHPVRHRGLSRPSSRAWSAIFSSTTAENAHNLALVAGFQLHATTAEKHWKSCSRRERYEWKWQFKSNIKISKAQNKCRLRMISSDFTTEESLSRLSVWFPWLLLRREPQTLPSVAFSTNLWRRTPEKLSSVGILTVFRRRQSEMTNSVIIQAYSHRRKSGSSCTRKSIIIMPTLQPYRGCIPIQFHNLLGIFQFCNIQLTILEFWYTFIENCLIKNGIRTIIVVIQ